MITCKEIKDQLSDDDIIKLLELLGSEKISENDNYLTSTTICHHGNSCKLYYYKENKTFQCYTNCGSMDIFGVIQNSKNMNLQESIRWIRENLLLEENNSPKTCISDWKFIRSYRRKSLESSKDLKIYDDKILNIFQRIYYDGWIKEGISVETMIKYNIMYSAYNQQIIIPHYNKNNDLIGIRARNLNYEEYGTSKYTPFYDGDIIYSHSLGNNLYGLNKNKDCIKRKRKVMIVESEKSVMQCDTMFGDDNFSLAICGSHLSNQQIKLLLDLDVNEVILALDKQYKSISDDDFKKWNTHLKSIAKKLLPYTKVSIILDLDNKLEYKDSPTDKGKDTLMYLLDKKIKLYF